MKIYEVIGYNWDDSSSAGMFFSKEDAEEVQSKLKALWVIYEGNGVFTCHVGDEPIIKEIRALGGHEYYDLYKIIEHEVNLSQKDKEDIAEKVHDTWMSEKRKNGFHSPNECESDERNSFKRATDSVKERFYDSFDAMTYKWCDYCHPDMYPYNELSEEVKELDRKTVETVMKSMK